MRHRMRSRRFSRESAHRQHMFANMAISLVEHEQITTTLPKAKELRPIVEKLITLGKKGGLHRRRLIIARTRSEDRGGEDPGRAGPALRRPAGGYCRIMHAGFRHGDNAPVAVIELVDRDVDAKGRVDRERLAAEAALAGPAEAA
jgi:large subunit ribosomal protein L17